jgi:hypothetical protein
MPAGFELKRKKEKGKSGREVMMGNGSESP